MNWNIQHHAVVDSTMRLAAPLPLGSVVVADQQTAGIGRHGHAWESRPGDGLYVSLVLEPHPVLTLALGLAAQQAIEQVTGVRCAIRWPNDLMLAERKLGGILVELHENRAVAGIGINVGQRVFAPELKRLATSLWLETGLEFRRQDLLNALLQTIPLLTALTTAEVIANWERSSEWARAKAVRVDLGDREICGTTAGLDPHGFLRVRTDEGILETVYAGGVRPR